MLATDPTLIPDALEQVPPHKRIPANRPLFDFYAAMYPGYAVALCCFDNREALAANPLLMWYSPHDPDRFALPAIDCHTGAVPDLGAQVLTDHWVVFGTDEARPGWGAEVRYAPHYDQDNMPQAPLNSGPAAPSCRAGSWACSSTDGTPTATSSSPTPTSSAATSAPCGVWRQAGPRLCETAQPGAVPEVTESRGEDDSVCRTTQ